MFELAEEGKEVDVWLSALSTRFLLLFPLAGFFSCDEADDVFVNTDKGDADDDDEEGSF